MANSDVELKEVAISVDRDSLHDFVKKGQNRGNHLQPSISMVPRRYRDQNRSCFDPRVVSIGPLHRGHEYLQENEGLKGAYIHDLLARLNSPLQQTLERCLLEVNPLIEKIRLCYGGMNNYDDSEVAKMMVIDACFILECIQKKYEENDLLYGGNMFTRHSIFTDFLLIENQIPFFVLQAIFDLTLKKIHQGNSLITLLLDHVLCDYKPSITELKIDNNYNFKHILEILHESCRPHFQTKHTPESVKVTTSHSVVELDRAGLKFKPNQKGNLEMVVENESFRWLQIFRSFRKPTLRMPVLTIQDETELLLRNLIAYEQSFPNAFDHYFTSFAVAMDMLVDSKEDVAKLVESKVIINLLGSNEDAAKLINNLCNEVTYFTFLYEREFQELNDYYKSYWPKNMARLKRTYFNSPWNVIALVAGIILFALTAIQTIFTVMS